MATPDRIRTRSAVYGLALGDAWGDPVEFRSYPEILRLGAGEGPPAPARLRVTDDTQMSLYVWQGLTRARSMSTEDVRAAIGDAFLEWLQDPDMPDRAPGGTCLQALQALRGTPARLRAAHWHRATVAHSWGCGTVMRAPWIGLHPRVEPAQVGHIARVQATLTHGHPGAVAAAAAAAEATLALATGALELGDVARWLGRWARVEMEAGYDLAALGPLAGHNGMTRAAYQEDGARAVDRAGYVAELATAAMLNAHARGRLWRVDPCTHAGEGWDAMSCLAVAVACADMAPALGPVGALRRAAATGGDSDSIAAVAGALIGAGTGEAWPWLARLESRYARELREVAA